MSATLQPYRHYYVGPEFEHACVHDVMRVGVVTCQPDASLRDACRIMVSYQIHSLLVGDIGAGESPWGIADRPRHRRRGHVRHRRAHRFGRGEPRPRHRSGERDAGRRREADGGPQVHLLAVQPDAGRPVGVISALKHRCWRRARARAPARLAGDIVFQVRIHGRGGQGVVTAAELLSVAAFVEGRHAQAFPTFGSERTGAPVVAFCRIDDGRKSGCGSRSRSPTR